MYFGKCQYIILGNFVLVLQWVPAKRIAAFCHYRLPVLEFHVIGIIQYVLIFLSFFSSIVLYRLITVVTCVSSSFFSISKQYSVVWIYYILFIHSFFYWFISHMLLKGIREKMGLCLYLALNYFFVGIFKFFP